MILDLCKGVHCVDLDESFPTSIYLQNLASIPPRTSPVKFARSSGPTTTPSRAQCGSRAGRASALVRTSQPTSSSPSYKRRGGDPSRGPFERSESFCESIAEDPADLGCDCAKSPNFPNLLQYFENEFGYPRNNKAKASTHHPPKPPWVKATSKPTSGARRATGELPDLAPPAPKATA